MRKQRLDMLLSPLFVLAISLLLANDFLFKPLFHNWFTGKLSDLAGLFAFFVFWSAFFPRQNKAIGLMIAVSFAYWKSDWSQPLIDWWNELALYRIGRVIDPADLIALIVLPGADFYMRRVEAQQPSACFGWKMQLRRLAICLICGLSIFAFTATQFVNDRKVSLQREYEFRLSKSNLLTRLHSIGLQEIRYWRSPDELVRSLNLTDEERNHYDLITVEKFCNSSITAHVTLHDKGGKTVLKLSGFRFWCDKYMPQYDEEILQIFEREVIEKLRTK